MEIHKPKAAHSVREFFIEIGTIVTGIVIALALEQALEALHEHKIQDEARAAVREEAGENLNWVNIRERREPCVRQRLVEVTALLDRAGRQEHFAVAQHVHIPVISKITTHVWDANAQSGRASLFGAKEQSDFGDFYYTMDDFNSAQDKEAIAWARLGALKGRDRLTPASIDAFQFALAEAKYYNFRILLLVRRTHEWADVLHIKPVISRENHIMAATSTPFVCASITDSNDDGLGDSLIADGTLLPGDMP